MMSCYLQQCKFPITCTFLYFNCQILILSIILCILPIQIHSFQSIQPNFCIHQHQHNNKCLEPPSHHIHSMTLIPIEIESLESCLVLGVPTAEQYGAYWGRTSKEQYSAIFESASVTFLGLFMSYFLSFVIGSPLATLFGTIAAFWVLFGPELKAYQRNLDLRGGRDLIDPFMYPENAGGGLYGTYFFSSVSNIAVVEDVYSSSNEEYPLYDFLDYTMEKDDEESFYGIPWKLRLCVEDTNGRSLQVHARMSEEYLDIEVGMPVATVLLSTGKEFTKLEALTDFYIPDADCWVGDYPYLNKVEFVNQLVNSRLLSRALEDERGLVVNDSDNEGDDDDFIHDDTTTDEEGFNNNQDFFNRKEGELV